MLVAGGDAGQFAAATHDCVDVVEGALHLGLQRLEGGARVLARDLEDARFGLVEQAIGAVALVEAHFDDLGGGGDQAPLDRLVADDARVVDDVRGGRLVVCDLGEEDRAADRIELLLDHQPVRKRVQVDGLVLLRERHHRGVELAMDRVVEVVRLQFDVDRMDRCVVEQQCGEHGLLGFQVVRRHATGEMRGIRRPLASRT